MGRSFPRPLRVGFEMLVLLCVALSPFATYEIVRADRRETPLIWPAPIALVSASAGTLTDLALLQVSPRPALIRFPVDAAMTVPGTGMLRARTTYFLGGASMVARGLAGALAMDVPYWAEWHGAALRTAGAATASNLGSDLDEVTRLVANWRIGAVRSISAPGDTHIDSGIRIFTIDESAVKSALASPTLQVPPRHAGAALKSVPHQNVTVEILNRSGVAGAAGRLRDLLVSLRFKVLRVGTSNVTANAHTTIFYRRNYFGAVEIAQAINIKGVVAKPIPKGFSTTADVLILAGRDVPQGKLSVKPTPTR